MTCWHGLRVTGLSNVGGHGCRCRRTPPALVGTEFQLGTKRCMFRFFIRSTSPRGGRGTGCCFGLAYLSENRRDDGGEPSLRQPQAARFAANKPRGAKRMAPLTGGRALFDWIAMIDPVG